MILAVDTSALILLVNPTADPPEDPDTQMPVTHARERVELFLAGLSAADTLIIPTPVLAELLVGADEGGPGVLEAISGMARVKVRPFGERAAVETAMMTREAIAAGDKRGGSQAPWQKVKVDRQVVAVARAEGATRIYADDHNLGEFARRLGMEVFSTWDLPVPEGVENLFTAAGIPLEPQTTTAVDADAPIVDSPAAQATATDAHRPRAINLDGDADGGESDEVAVDDPPIVNVIANEPQDPTQMPDVTKLFMTENGVGEDGKPEPA